LSSPRRRKDIAASQNMYIKAGYDHLILVQTGPEQDRFFEFFERELVPIFAPGCC
jgi:hypothetical protein